MSLRLFATTALALSMLTVVPALAQTKPAKKPAAQTEEPADSGDAAAPAPAPAPAAAAGPTTPPISGPQPDWVKMCQKDDKAKVEICQTSRDLRAETGQTLASVAVREQKSDKGAKRIMVMAIPPGMQIQPGVRVLVDTQQAIMGKYSVCFPQACMVEAELTDAVMANLRKGTTLNLQLVAPGSKVVVLPIGLDGLAKALDGNPLDPTKVQDDQKKLNDELQKKAKEALEQLKAQPAPQQ